MISQEKIKQWKKQYRDMLSHSHASDLLDECFKPLTESYQNQQKEIDVLKNKLSGIEKFAQNLLDGMNDIPVEFEKAFKENFWDLLA